MLKCFQKLLPDCLASKCARSATECKTKYVPPQESRILCLQPEVAVPQPSSGIFRIDFLSDDQDLVSVKWTGELPTKCEMISFKRLEKDNVFMFFFAGPALLTKIIKAVDEKSFSEFILNKQLKLLVEEWKK